MKDVSLKELVGGALQEKFNHSFARVIENMQDVNTPYKNSREITIKLKFTQNEARNDVKVGIVVSEKVAPQSALETAFAVGTNLESGDFYAEEYGSQVKGQISLSDLTEKEAAQDVEVAAQKVIDMRRASN